MRRSRLNGHIDNGGRVFPLQVGIDESQNIYVTGIENLDEDIEVGDKIAAINGIAASEIVGNILNRMHGDTASNRRAFAAERFAKMYWLRAITKSILMIVATLSGIQSLAATTEPRVRILKLVILCNVKSWLMILVTYESTDFTTPLSKKNPFLIS